MVSEKVTVINPQGFHMRPATAFVAEMGKFSCTVSIITGASTIDGKSLMSIIAACIKCGTSIEIVCDGPQEQEALHAAIQLVKNGFGE